MAQSMIVFDSILGSNLPDRKKSAVLSYLEKVSGHATGLAKRHGVGKHHIEHGVHAFRQTSESILTGSLLGAAHAEVGLDATIFNFKTPVDAVLGVLLLGAGVKMAGHELSGDLRNAGSQMIGVFSFRKTYELIAQAKIRGGKQPVGKFAGESEDSYQHHDGKDSSMGEDPIVAAARLL